MAKKTSGNATGGGAGGMTYAQSGVDIDAGDRMVDLIEKHMRRTYGPRVLGAHGAFAGLFRLDFNEKLFKRNYRDPVLVACTDGVGSKVKLAPTMGIYDTVGIDLVAMSVNDMIVQGAEPLIFLDYIGTHQLEPGRMAEIVKGVADGCEQAGCALLGGETAELPDLYAPGDFDLAGFGVGVVELKRVVEGEKAEAGDVLLGLSSSGIHSNGYSLVRAIVKEKKLDLFKVYADAHPQGRSQVLGQVLLEPTRIYAQSVVQVLHSYKVKQVVTAMAHITGGGLPGNVPRTIGPNLNAKLDKGSWEIPPIFRFLQQQGNVAEEEMYRVFNMGLGYVLAVRPHFAQAVLDKLRRAGETVSVVGKLVRGTGQVVM